MPSSIAQGLPSVDAVAAIYAYTRGHANARAYLHGVMGHNGLMSRRRKVTRGSPGKSPTTSSPTSPLLPDVSKWQPRKDAASDIGRSYRRRCEFIEQRLRVRVAEERAGNIDNFDSGIGVEEIFRDELSQLLPERYQVTNGVVSDRLGNTAGHCDAVIFNDTWFPAIKSGATPQSRRQHLPIEGIYGVVEVKQSLSVKTLDEAMQKLVVCHRLTRPPTPRDRIVENRETGTCVHAISNPLYSCIFAIELSRGSEFQTLITRFVEINRLLKRSEMVSALVLLGQGAVFWGCIEDDELKQARFFYEDLYLPIRPIYLPASAGGHDTFYRFARHLSAHLYSSVLGAEDIAVAYGESEDREQVEAATPEWEIPPDRELLDFLDTPCKDENHAGKTIR